MPPGVGYPAGTSTSTTAGKIFASSRLNPARRSEEAIGRQRTRTPKDRYGFGAISDIPLAFAEGRERGRADDIDAQNAAAIDEQINKTAKTAEEKEKLKTKIQIFGKAADLSTKDEGLAVQFLNQFKDDIGLNEGVAIAGFKPDPAKGGTQLILNIDGKDQPHWLGKDGKMYNYSGEGGKPVLMSKEDMSKISSVTGKGKDKVGSTKERILKKISEVGFDELSPNEQDAWNRQSNDDKNIAQEVLKNLRVNETYKNLNNENDADGSRREAMIAGATEMVRSLFNPEGRTAGDNFLDVGQAGAKDDFVDLSNSGNQQDLSGEGGRAPGPVGLDDIPELEEDTAGTIPGLSAEEAQALPKRQAPDGKFYVEDPNTGQFYEVEG